MKKKFYLPRKESELVIWLNNFSSKLKQRYAAVFGISPADADNVVAFAAFYSFLVNYIDQLSTYGEGLTAYKNTYKNALLPVALPALPPLNLPAAPAMPSTTGMITVIRKMVSTIKAHSLYTSGIGEDLGIEGAQIAFNADTYKAKGKVKQMIGFVKVDFTKKGVEAMNVYGSLNDKDEWQLLGTSIRSPFRDRRRAAAKGRPEKRQYRLRGVIGDREIGVWSDVISLWQVEDDIKE